MIKKQGLISINDLSREEIEEIFQLADESYQIVKRKFRIDAFGDKIMASLFYEASTRTRFSFEAAMLKLGGDVISTESAEHFSSAIKGELLEDTIKIIGGYADVIVLRHHEMGAARRAASVSSVPIINAGDGHGEHPTQAILDLYTIQKELGNINNFKIAMIGDLLYGRTIHSLIHLFKFCKNIEVYLVSPEELKLPQEYKSFLESHNIKFYEASSLNDIVTAVDILYITRIQKERFSCQSLYDKVKDSFSIDSETLRQLGENTIVMHPLPRLKEVSREIDSDKRAAYFRQAQNGLYIRMAILRLILGTC